MRTMILASLGVAALAAALAAAEAAELHRQQRRLDVLQHDLLTLLRDLTVIEDDRRVRPVR